MLFVRVQSSWLWPSPHRPEGKKQHTLIMPVSQRLYRFKWNTHTEGLPSSNYTAKSTKSHFSKVGGMATFATQGNVSTNKLTTVITKMGNYKWEEIKKEKIKAKQKIFKVSWDIYIVSKRWKTFTDKWVIQSGWFSSLPEWRTGRRQA